MLQLDSVSINRGNSVIFSNLKATLNTPGLNLIRGKNGSGKTTLLRTIAGFIPIESGKVIYNRKDITFRKNEWVKKIIYVDSHNGLSEDLTVFENLEAWLNMKGWSSSKQKVTEALKSLDMDKYSNIYISKCSEGLRKRAALVRLYFSYIFEVKFWLLDEPSNGLDQASILLFKKMITNFLQQNGTIILTTHDKNLFNDKHNVINLDLLKELRAK